MAVGEVHALRADSVERRRVDGVDRAVAEAVGDEDDGVARLRCVLRIQNGDDADTRSQRPQPPYLSHPPSRPLAHRYGGLAYRIRLRADTACRSGGQARRTQRTSRTQRT